MPRGGGSGSGGTKSKKKQRTTYDDSGAPPSIPVADMTGSAANVAQLTAAQAQQLAEQTESQGGNFNVFDQPNVQDAKILSAMREDQDPAAANELANAGSEALMQLASATKAMQEKDNEARRRQAEGRTGADGTYVDADSSYLAAAENMFAAATSSSNALGANQAETGKKRKRDAGGSSKASTKAEMQPRDVYLDPNDQNAPPHEFPTHGPFTASEKAIVEGFADEFKAEYSLDDTLLADLVQSKDRKMDDVTRDFWTRIYGIIPNRDNKAMQRHVRRRFHNYEMRGKWSSDDDERLRQAFDEKPNQWTKIGEALNRMPEDCRDRWRNYVVCGESRKVDQWDPDEEARLSEAVNDLITAVKEEARVKAREEGVAFRNNQDWLSLINFNIVSEKLNHERSRIQCLQHWKAMVQREEEGRQKRRMKRPAGSAPLAKIPRIGKNLETARQHWLQMLPGDKHAILREILESDVYDEDKINWSLMIQRSPLKFWNAKDREYFLAKIQKQLPFSENATFRERIGEALDYIEHVHQGELENYYKPDTDPRRAAVAELQREAIDAVEKGESTADIVERARKQKREHRKADRETVQAVAPPRRTKQALTMSNSDDIHADASADNPDAEATQPGDVEMQGAGNREQSPNIDPRLDAGKGSPPLEIYAKKIGKKRGRPRKDKGSLTSKKSNSKKRDKFKSADVIDETDDGEEQPAAAPTARMTDPDVDEGLRDAVKSLQDAKRMRNDSSGDDTDPPE